MTIEISLCVFFFVVHRACDECVVYRIECSWKLANNTNPPQKHRFFLNRETLEKKIMKSRWLNEAKSKTSFNRITQWFDTRILSNQCRKKTFQFFFGVKMKHEKAANRIINIIKYLFGRLLYFSMFNQVNADIYHFHGYMMPNRINNYIVRVCLWVIV